MKNLFLFVLLGIIIVSCTREDKPIVNRNDSSTEIRSPDKINVQVDGKLYNTLKFGELQNEIVVNSFPSISDTLNLMSTALTNINMYLNSQPSNKYILVFGNTTFDCNHIDFLEKRTKEQLNRGIKDIKLLQDSLYMMGFLDIQERNLMLDFIEEIFNLEISLDSTRSKFIERYNLIYGPNASSSTNSSLSQIYVATFIGMIIHSKSLWINWDYESNPCYYRNTSGKIVKDVTNTPAALNPILLDAGGGLVKTWVWIIRNSDRIESNEDLGGEFLEVIVDNILDSSTVGMWGTFKSWWRGN